LTVQSQFDVPVLFLVFSRPDTTKQVFEAIRAQRPSRLYVAADGPRQSRPGESALCEETRKVATAVDWPCELKTLFRDSNMGCRNAVSSAITWFFENEPEGMILEDDCLPSQDFFRFCRDLLSRYRDDEKVMHIAGINFQFGVRRGEASYYFSRIPHIWGWASWRRAWRLYDVEMKGLPDFIASGAMKDVFPRRERSWQGFLGEFQATSQGKINTWDYQWGFTLCKEGGLSIIPNVNLVSNIGSAATTHEMDTRTLHLPFGELGEIIHPNSMTPDLDADETTCKMMFPDKPSLPMRVLRRLRREIKSLFG
jgi:hypothetical protein